jgi:hypothetical protein
MNQRRRAAQDNASVTTPARMQTAPSERWRTFPHPRVTRWPLGIHGIFAGLTGNTDHPLFERKSLDPITTMVV